jgi:hypothetical protein
VRTARVGYRLLRFSVRGRGGSGFRLPGEGQRRTGDSSKREVRNVYSSTREDCCESPLLFTAKVAISPAPARIARQNPPPVRPSIALSWKMVLRSTERSVKSRTVASGWAAPSAPRAAAKAGSILKTSSSEGLAIAPYRHCATACGPRAWRQTGPRYLAAHGRRYGSSFRRSGGSGQGKGDKRWDRQVPSNKVAGRDGWGTSFDAIPKPASAASTSWSGSCCHTRRASR